MKTKEEIIKGIEHLFSNIDWKNTALDADAVQIMNTFKRDIEALAVRCEDVDGKTIRAIVGRTLEENDGKCLDTMEERAEVAAAITEALINPE